MGQESLEKESRQAADRQRVDRSQVQRQKAGQVTGAEIRRRGQGQKPDRSRYQEIHPEKSASG